MENKLYKLLIILSLFLCFCFSTPDGFSNPPRITQDMSMPQQLDMTIQVDMQNRCNEGDRLAFDNNPEYPFYDTKLGCHCKKSDILLNGCYVCIPSVGLSYLASSKDDFLDENCTVAGIAFNNPSRIVEGCGGYFSSVDGAIHYAVFPDKLNEAYKLLNGICTKQSSTIFATRTIQNLSLEEMAGVN